MVVSPGGLFTFPRQDLDHPFTRAQAAQVREDVAALYCHGSIIYKDIFGKRHTTKFCRRFVRRWQDWVTAGSNARNLCT